GKIVLVIGASRGLGASFALALASVGAHVIAAHAESSSDAECLRAAAEGLPGKIVPAQCDATETAACEAIRQHVQTRFGRLDWLICNAAPSLRPLHIEVAALDRIEMFLQSGFALTVRPLAHFLDLLSDHDGCVLLVSSSAVESLQSKWPH